tara:strand:+ start:2863 stop:3528 length:666 start_codon:yes stop_codon:yes gene_type:complete
MFRVNYFLEGDILRNYLDKVANSYCPFISPSIKSNLLYFSHYDLSDETDENRVVKLALLISYVHAEYFIYNRKNISGIDKILYNENISFTFNDILAIKEKDILSWVHWCLKANYTKNSMLFGKFTKNTQEFNKDNIEIPPSPINFISIRSSIKSKDIKFFNKAPQLVDDFMLDSEGEIYLNIDDLKSITKDKLMHIVNSLSQGDMFKDILNMSKQKLYNKD